MMAFDALYHEAFPEGALITLVEREVAVTLPDTVTF
jgi:hypothetical protein